ncbi:hypothetical protein [Burkholderia ubonensis]|uniref:Uncharacterized protein n=1 Tax=Burkholderia ubonensis TaxID=101571 RepID=A0ABD4DZC6_9BURK|nr:hypothetical protein [Burkholderia ubonensis]KVN83456.1 hypothetical protein WJ68_16220 [Burkholderia ubonensis]
MTQSHDQREDLLAANPNAFGRARRGLPPRDTSQPAQAQGTFRKYDVRRVDGRDAPGGDREGDEYFVLNLTRDPHAKPAIEAYMRSCAAAFPQLAADLAARAPEHAHAVSPAGQHGHGVPVEQRVQPYLEADGGMLDTLIGLVERGPLWDGDVPSKAGRNKLIEWGLATRVVVNGEEGYTAATYAGSAAFLARYGSDTIAEAMKARKRGRA